MHEMKSRSILIELLENQADKGVVDASFKRIDECTKNFHVRQTKLCPNKIYVYTLYSLTSP